MSPERKLERQLVQYCKKNNLYTRKFSSPASPGVPDRIIVGPAGTIFLELKSPGKRPTPLQLREMELIRKAGGRAYWTSDYEGARAAADSTII